MKVFSILKDKWWLFVLVLIFLYSYYIRSFNIVPDRLLSFDPIFQYRYTYYVANYGHLPVWDELTYYVGRLIEINTSPPLMLYITAAVYWIVKYLGMAMSLTTLASYMSAIYGALIVFPAFFLVKEITNEYGGMMSAVLTGTSPQILTRTFGSSYDTDQVVLFFLILTLYLGFFALKRKKLYSYCLALIGFTGFLMTWGYSFYSFFILAFFVAIYFILSVVFSKKKDSGGLNLTEGMKTALPELKSNLIFFIVLLVGLSIFAYINGENIMLHITNVISFAQSAEEWIVNVSIAELQTFNIFTLDGWILSLGRFVTGNAILDDSFLIAFAAFIALGFLMVSRKRDLLTLSILLTLFLIGIYTTFRGVRFTEFTSALFIAVISSGFGILFDWSKKDSMKKAIVLGLGIFLAFNAMQISVSAGKTLGPDINVNWDNAWNFLKTQTPEFSIVGTWWDPGHMINGLADRRNFADGAHCHNQCLYTINDRIVDLGNIMVTSDENESLSLIRKYQGDSPKVYWIASDDLIGKFQWLQYFGTGCDARVDQRCPLYIQIPEQSRSVDNNGNIVLRNYGSITVFQGTNIPIPIYIQNLNGAIFDEVIYYYSGNVTAVKFNETQKQELIQALKPLEKQLNFRFTNQSIPMTVWIPQGYSYIVAIPQTLRESVFTKMFMLEGEGLEHFKQVFRNEQVKIYEVV
jgi:dolichyl-diphosphooligosaccharide--protein glycosyltransferase